MLAHIYVKADTVGWNCNVDLFLGCLKTEIIFLSTDASQVLMYLLLLKTISCMKFV